MTRQDSSNFSKKYPPGMTADPAVSSEIKSRAKNNELPCAAAFDIAKKTGVPPREVGVALDMLNIRLTKCRLGLFGYKPEKKITKPVEDADQALTEAIKEKAAGSRLACADAWQIALDLGVSKMTVSGMCEQLETKIKPCQLGAF